MEPWENIQNDPGAPGGAVRTLRIILILARAAIMGVFPGTNATHAVVRRLVAEARQN